MEDVLTETPPPSRFFEEDLDNFATAPPRLPPPILILPPNPNPNSNTNTLLLIAISQTSLALLQRIRDKTIVGTLVLPELPLARTSYSFDIFAAGGDKHSVVLAAVQCPVAAERARAVAKVLLGGVSAERVVVMDAIKVGNYRGRITADDEGLVFKMETREERRRSGEKMVGNEEIDYLPSGSVVDGLGAAVMAECEMRRIRGTMVVAPPEHGRRPEELVAATLGKVMERLGIHVDGGNWIGVSPGFGSDLYT